jgi:flavodoxin I
MVVTVIYGSDGGATEALAGRIAAKAGGRRLNIKAAKVADFESCDLLILGSPTYGLGDLQCDWEDNLGTLKSANLARKRVALFGTGDQMSYPDTFADALGLLYDHVSGQGALVVGGTDIAGYDFQASAAVRDGRFVGLVLDQDTQPSKSEGRIAAWISQLI